MSEHVKSDIPFYVNGDLPEARRQQVEAHLADCGACRQLAEKAKNKVARLKRQSSKGSGSAAPVPNLLVTRLGRQAGVAQRPRQTPWGWIVFVLVLLAGGAWMARRYITPGWMVGTPLGGALVQTSTDTAAYQVGDSTGAVAGSTDTVAGMTPAMWGGQESAIKETRLVVIRSRPAWRALWSEMGQTDIAPRVNFGENAIVGVFLGERPAGVYQIAFGAPQDGERSINVPYAVTKSTEAPTGTTPVHPYGLTTVPASSKRIHFTQQPT
jgi:hypothetical protein